MICPSTLTLTEVLLTLLLFCVKGGTRSWHQQEGDILLTPAADDDDNDSVVQKLTYSQDEDVSVGCGNGIFGEEEQSYKQQQQEDEPLVFFSAFKPGFIPGPVDFTSIQHPYAT
jgi:hypothetical protein